MSFLAHSSDSILDHVYIISEISKISDSCTYTLICIETDYKYTVNVLSLIHI